MISFKQKNVIKSYKLILQNKLNKITEDTENATAFLNNCLLEFKNRVDDIVKIKDDKFLSLYENLSSDIERFRDKLFILQNSLEESNDDSSQNEDEEEESEHTSTTDHSNQESKIHINQRVSTSELSKNVCNLEQSVVFENNAESKSYQSCSSLQNSNCSNQSCSQNSCYRSTTSNISEFNVIHNEAKSDKQNLSSHHAAEFQSTSAEFHSAEFQGTSFAVSPHQIHVPAKVSGILSYIVNPGDFWIQLDSFWKYNINYTMSENSQFVNLKSIKKGDFCLAPFKSNFYYRAQSLTDSTKEIVKVHFIDHGSTQEVPLQCLKYMPFEAFDIPAQAIHCYLYGITPIDGSWSEESIRKFKDFQNCRLDIEIKSKEESYGVQLTAKLSEDLNEDFSVEIAFSLCRNGYAILENEPVHSGDRHCGTLQIYPESKNTDSSSHNITAISNDSGVSVTSTYKPSQQIIKDNTHTLDLVNNSCKKKLDLSYTQNGNSLQRSNSLNLKNFDKPSLLGESANYSLCSMCKSNSFCLHLQVRSAKLVFVKEDMMIVMLSHIVDLHEFYVNIAMENSINLDDLRSQMTEMYDSQRDIVPPVSIEDLQKNMFCAGFFDVDNHWYRVKVLTINSEGRNKNQVLVQYIDYGNTATINCSDLLPLSPGFSWYPAFAIKCSLAGVVPTCNDNQKVSSGCSIWSADSISAFKQLTSFDRCLTAQVCENLTTNDCHAVLLWDRDESEDILINQLLADQGVAVFDKNILIPQASTNIIEPPQELDAMNDWDPLTEEYNSIQNSYANKDHEDIQIVTDGYKARDEEYICKYYSLRGYCPRGNNCTYEHLPMLECGVTRDQEEVYCLDMLPLLDPNAVHILVQVSTVINPSFFYIILPFGSLTVSEIDTLAKSGSPYEKIENMEAKYLFTDMNKHYTESHFDENIGLALSPGTIVVAKRAFDEQFHRGRVLDSRNAGRGEEYKIFFVDFGNSEWVTRKLIRSIAPQFLYTPFQAVQCSLHGVQPIESQNNTWQSKAIRFFKEVVDGQTLLAEIIHRSPEKLYLTLQKTSQDDHRLISQMLVSRGFASACTAIPSAVPSSRFVPG